MNLRYRVGHDDTLGRPSGAIGLSRFFCWLLGAGLTGRRPTEKDKDDGGIDGRTVSFPFSLSLFLFLFWGAGWGYRLMVAVDSLDEGLLTLSRSG